MPNTSRRSPARVSGLVLPPLAGWIAAGSRPRPVWGPRRPAAASGLATDIPSLPALPPPAFLLSPTFPGFLSPDERESDERESIPRLRGDRDMNGPAERQASGRNRTWCGQRIKPGFWPARSLRRSNSPWVVPRRRPRLWLEPCPALSGECVTGNRLRCTATRPSPGLAQHPLMVDMQVIARRQDHEHRASITCMISHYVARRAKVIFDHPHNAGK